MKKLVLVAGVLIAATTAASAQGYVYYGNPYGYGLGVYDYSAGSYPGFTLMSGSHTRRRRASTGTPRLAIGCTTGAAGRGEAITEELTR